MFSVKIRKAIAVFLLTIFINSVVTPTISYALTAGPSAPEFSSFEPVDTTDMVNLATGEFVYNTPILEVPGPEGGYPLSLSYHAGIKLDQEASWVGLGFTLNPGAINRTVDGFADDNVQAKREVRDYWGGGTSVTKTFSFGLNVPKTGIGINYSLARTTDTYKGFSRNYQVSFSSDPVNFALNIGASVQAFNASNYRNLKQVNENVGQLTGGSSMGVSITSKGIKTNLSLMGIGIASKNNNAGKISSFTNETNVGTFPIGWFGSFTLKDFYTRYWSDESQSLFTYGALYPALGNEKIGSDQYRGKELISYAFDSYNVYDDAPLNEPTGSGKIVDDVNDPTKQLGGSLPAFDRYEVLGQGIGGSMQPHIFENGDMFGQNFYERNPIGQTALDHPSIEYKSLRKFTDKKVDFRFLNDFSNSLTITTPEFKAPGINRLDAQAIEASEEGFNDGGRNQKLAGSKHIEWFTNDEIVNGVARDIGFIDCYQNKTERKLEFDIYENYLQPEACLPYTGRFTYGKGQGSFKTDEYEGTDPYQDLLSPEFRSLKPKKTDLKKKIGGFMITNETGVTYHYALPVYNYNEYTKSKLKKPRKGVSTFREYKNDEPYVYTWLLTAITGPDYVDRNNNNILDDEDWGYWVKFDYGRWADAYQWRTPHTGFIDDIESEYETFSYGIKELYYLDAIETRTHKAIFIKSKRKDGRGVTSRLEGGSNPRRYTMDYRGHGLLQFNVSPVSTMKLDAIYLFRKDDLKNIPLKKSSGYKYNEATTSSPYAFSYTNYSSGGNYEHTITDTDPVTKVTIKQGEDFVYVKYHNGYLVYDDDDIGNLPQFKEKALRIIEFKTDYSLADGAPNSIGFFSDFMNETGESCVSFGEPSCDDKDIAIGNDFEWPRDFGTGCTPIEGNKPKCCESNEEFYSFYGVLQRYLNTNNCTNANSKYAGNFISYDHTGKLTLKEIKFLGRGGADLIPPTVFAYGENPDYVSYKYDNWGYYKSDYNPQFDNQDNPILNNTREITAASANQADAWSLTSVTTPLGAKTETEYEPNQYQRSVYNDFSVFSIEKLEHGTNSDDVKIILKEKKINLSRWFSVGSTINIKSLFVYKSGLFFNPYTTSSEIYNSDIDIITNVALNTITVQSSSLRFWLHSLPTNLQTPYFIAGFVKANDPEPDVHPKFAGGIRVRSVSVIDNHLGHNKTLYEYIDPSTSKPSGVMSFKPFTQTTVQYPAGVEFFDDILLGEEEDGLFGGTRTKEKKEARKELQQYQIDFQKLIDEPFKKLLAFSKEAPAPGAIYEWVKVTNFLNDQKFENYIVHHFKVFKEDMIEKEVENTPFPGTDRRKVTIKNKAIDVGSILSIKSYNIQNSLLKSTDYRYLYDENDETFEESTIATKQGVVEQSFHKSLVLREYKIDTDYKSDASATVIGGNVDSDVDLIYKKEKNLITKRQDRSNAVTSIKETDHVKGLVTETQNHAFDFFTGQVTKTFTTDSYGNKYLAVNEPAYVQYPGMGLKIYNSLNKHMLTQTGSTFSYKVDDDYAPTGLMSASIQTWSDQVQVLDLNAPQNGIWRKHSMYEWNGIQPLNPSDGTYRIADFEAYAFKWTDPSNSTYWEKTAELSLYDQYSHSLEARDINNNKASTRMDPDHEFVIASTVNGGYYETACSGAEFSTGNTVDEGGVNRGDGNPTSIRAHSGNYSLLVGFNSKGFNYTLKASKADLNKTYRASVWAYAPGEGEKQSELDKIQLYYVANGIEKEVHPIMNKNKSKSWYLLNLDIEPQGAADVFIGVKNNTGRGVYFDDFRIHPIDGSMTSYAYDQSTGEVTYMLDHNNLYTRFEYDKIGRLIRTSRESLNFDFGVDKESFKADHVLQETKYNYGKQSGN